MKRCILQSHRILVCTCRVIGKDALNITIRYLFTVCCVIVMLISCIDDVSANSMEQDQNPDRDPIVWSVSFEGNEDYSNIVLGEIIATQKPNLLRKLFRSYDEYMLNETELRRDRIRIIRYYERRGYDQVDVNVEHEPGKKEWKRDVTFRIREGEPIRINSSEITVEADSVTEETLRSSRDFQRLSGNHELQEGQIFQTIRKSDVSGNFTQMMQNHGYPWASVDIEEQVDSLAKSADVTIRLNPGPKSYFDSFSFEGIESVPERVVFREMGIKKGEPYDRRKIQDAQRQIFDHHLFRFATITLTEQEEDSTLDLRVRVRENSLRTVQATVGFGSEELLRGQVNWQNRNISGTGHRLGFNARGSFIEQRVGADYLIPYVFNSRSSFVTAPFGQRRLEPAFELMRVGISNSLIYQLKRSQTATLSYEFTANEELSRRRDASLPDSILGYNVSSLTLTGYYSQRVTREPDGWLIQPSAEFSGTFGEASFKFQKLSLDIRHYLRISRNTTIAGRLNLGTIFYNQPDSLPANIRYFSGGTNSVRGWSRQSLGPKRASFDDGEFDGYVPIGGRALATFNLELRQQLNFLFNGFGFGLFLDGGQVWRAIDRIDERPVQFGTGGGLRYQSPIGPVRIDVGYKVNPTDDDLGIFEPGDESNGWDRIGIHFSIGQAF